MLSAEVVSVADFKLQFNFLLLVMITSIFYLISNTIATNYDISLISISYGAANGVTYISYYPFPQFSNGTYYHNITSPIYIQPPGSVWTGSLDVTFNFTTDSNGTYYIYLPKQCKYNQSYCGDFAIQSGSLPTNVLIDGIQTVTNAEWNILDTLLLPLTDINSPINLNSGQHTIQINYGNYARGYRYDKLVLVRPISNFCSDSICDSVGSYIETYQSCPSDCTNCNDSNNYTYDYFNYTTQQCNHSNITCLTNTDCNDNNASTTDTCNNPGAVSSYCTNPLGLNVCGNSLCEWNGNSETCNSCQSDCSCTSSQQCSIVQNSTYNNYSCIASASDAPASNPPSTPTSSGSSPTSSSSPIQPGETKQVTIQPTQRPISPSLAVPSILQSSLTLNFTIDKTVTADDLTRVKIGINDSLNIAATAQPIDKITNIQMTKSGNDVVYSIEGTNRGRFLFISVDVPSKVVLDASNGSIISVESSTAASVVLDKIINFLEFWK